MSKIVTCVGALMLLGCATAEVTRQDDGTFRVAVAYGEISSAAVLQQERDEAADNICPMGWSVVAEGDLTEAQYGGRWWRIRCTNG